MIERVKLKKKAPPSMATPEPKPLKTYGGAIECKFCKHYYIEPCTEQTQAKCPNMLALAKQKRSKR